MPPVSLTPLYNTAALIRQRIFEVEDGVKQQIGFSGPAIPPTQQSNLAEYMRWLHQLGQDIAVLANDIISIDDEGFWYDDMDLMNLRSIIKGDFDIGVTQLQLDIAGVWNSLSFDFAQTVDLAKERLLREITQAKQSLSSDLSTRISLAEVAVMQTKEEIKLAIQQKALAISTQLAGVQTVLADSFEVALAKTRETYNTLAGSVEAFFRDAPEDIALRIFKWNLKFLYKKG